MCNKERLLRNLQMIDFALTEDNLYLDSHPTCPEALAVDTVRTLLADLRTKKASTME
jgi:hypothetical protein